MSPHPSLSSKNNCPHNIFSRHYTLKPNLTNAEDSTVAYMLVLSTPYSTVLTTNVFIQVELCFVCNKKTNCQKRKPFIWRGGNHVVDCRITAWLVANKTETRQWTWVTVGIVQCSGHGLGGGGGVVGNYLYTCVSIYTCVTFWLCLIQYTLHKTQLSQK
jgi:hypothetical protein